MWGTDFLERHFLREENIFLSGNRIEIAYTILFGEWWICWHRNKRIVKQKKVKPKK